MSRKPFVPAALLGKLWRCIIEFEMLKEGDRVLIGLSGGKDSMFLTAALAEVQQYAPFRFDLACYTVDTMFSSDFPKADLESFCAQYGLKHYSSKVDVTEAWQHRTNTPCFTCAYFRRAATNRTALELGFNKVAWAHHHDDAVETFFLNLVASGQLKTFLPVTPLSRTGLTLIRPLLYYREAEIISMVDKLNLHPLKTPAPTTATPNARKPKNYCARCRASTPKRMTIWRQPCVLPMPNFGLPNAEKRSWQINSMHFGSKSAKTGRNNAARSEYNSLYDILTGGFL